jgi:alkaline phosphatase D
MMMKRAIAVVFVIALFVGYGPDAAGVEQYKRAPTQDMSNIVDGKCPLAINRATEYLEEHPDDLEALYVLAAAYARMGDNGMALIHARKAVAAGLPIERFVAGPRSLFAPLTASKAFQEFAEGRVHELMHGPLLGCVTDSSASVWVRTAGETTVTVRVSTSEDMSAPVRVQGTTGKAHDFTVVIAIPGLVANRRYYYTVQAGEDEAAGPWGFRTFPKAGSPAAFDIGFGGGAGYTPEHEHMWDTIRSHELVAFLQLGDNVYIDNPTRPAVQQYCYYRRQSRPEYRAFTAATAIFAIWDDHDFTINDGHGGPEVDKPDWKIPVWRLYMDNWNNPYYGGGESHPGCWHDLSIADVDFFMLDGRYYRTNPKDSTIERQSMLGPVQKQWLFEKLKASKGTFKVLASPVPWAFDTKPGSLDPWDGFKEEREEIFSFLEQSGIDGVILISADRHRSDAWRIERPDGYDLYEFESSRLTNIHTHEVMPGCLFGYNEKCSFGKLSFDTTKPDPVVTYTIVNIDNEVIHTLSLKRSELSHGQ